MERYDEMVEYMKQVASSATNELTMGERNLLSVAYKNVVGARRASLRIITSIFSKEQQRPDSQYLPIIKSYKDSVVKELDNVCDDILQLLTASPNLIATATDNESKVFYQKMAADYYRYLAEFSEGETKAEVSKKAEVAYSTAYETASKGLAPTHPIRLGLALNYSVFQFEVQNKADEACQLAKTSFDEAIAELDTLDEESYKDSTLIMQLLRDNLTLWTSDDADQAQPN